jgi:hypothetical protein
MENSSDATLVIWKCEGRLYGRVLDWSDYRQSKESAIQCCNEKAKRGYDGPIMWTIKDVHYQKGACKIAPDYHYTVERIEVLP